MRRRRALHGAKDDGQNALKSFGAEFVCQSGASKHGQLARGRKRQLGMQPRHAPKVAKVEAWSGALSQMMVQAWGGHARGLLCV